MVALKRDAGRSAGEDLPRLATGGAGVVSIGGLDVNDDLRVDETLFGDYLRRSAIVPRTRQNRKDGESRVTGG
jgi:hypothetical protein